MAATESYPEDLLYNKEHDWARVEGDEAVLGITWYAHDALGELVHYEPPAVGATIEKGKSYGEVESVKAVSDVIAPLSGEVIKDRPSRILRPGMALTIEPGLYVRPGEGVPEAFWNIGIRIEDDAIVTESGCELITRDVPVKADEIEALMRA